MTTHLKTNATRLLEAANIPFEVQEYEVDENDLSGMHVAQQLNIPPEQIFKTLVLMEEGKTRDCLVCCIPTCNELDLKKVAKAFGVKKCNMIPMKDLKRLTGYIRGGCSPIGMTKQYPTIFDETLVLFDKICVSAGQRGMQIVIEPGTLMNFVRGKSADLVK